MRMMVLAISCVWGMVGSSLAQGPPAVVGKGPEAWVYMDVGDCNGNDKEFTEGTSLPAEGLCPLHLERVAVCWDGAKYKNASNTKKDPSLPWCTYKTTTHGQCKGGGTPGWMYTCTKIR